MPDCPSRPFCPEEKVSLNIDNSVLPSATSLQKAEIKHNLEKTPREVNYI